MRTETEKAETVSTQKVQSMLVAWTNFLRKKMSGILRRIPRSNAKSGLIGFRELLTFRNGVVRCEIILIIKTCFFKVLDMERGFH